MKDAAQRDLPAPDEATISERYLRRGVEAPDLATVKDFLRFHAAASRGLIEGKLDLQRAY